MRGFVLTNCELCQPVNAQAYQGAVIKGWDWDGVGAIGGANRDSN